VPRGQAWQDVDRAATEKNPGGQTLQEVAPEELNVPAWHGAQSLRDVAPATVLAVPAGQDRHEALPWPGTELYRPAAQGMHRLADVAATASR
jgi:hypothetical protein